MENRTQRHLCGIEVVKLELMRKVDNPNNLSPNLKVSNVLEQETVGYCFALQKIRLEPKKIQKPEIAYGDNQAHSTLEKA